MLEVLNDPVASTTGLVAIATVLVAIATFVGSVIAANRSARSARESAASDSAAAERKNEIDERLGEANLLHEQARLAHEVSHRLTEFRIRDLDKLKEDAAVLSAAIRLARGSSGITAEHQRSAVEAAERLSLSYPPKTGFQEKLNIQLDHGIEEVFGKSTSQSREAVTKLHMNLWQLANEENEMKLAALRGEKRERAELVPY